MKSILIISQHIFPKQTPRAHRTTELAIEFSRQGYDVTVYAILGSYKYDDFARKYKIKVKDIRLRWQIATYNSDFISRRTFLDKALKKLFRRLIEFPDIELLFRIPEIILKEPIHCALISIANPHVIHWGCAKAKKKYPEKFPGKWIADCGDPYYNNGNSEKFKAKFKKMEYFFCANTNFISVPVSSAIKCYDKKYEKKIKVIPQGFNFKTVGKINLNPINKIPTFAFCGNFFSGYRDPTIFFEFLLKIKINFKFIIYTDYTSLISKYLPILKDKIEIRPTIFREEMIKEIKKMDFLLNIENINLPGQLPSKLIDYAISNRPILSVNTGNFSSEKIIEFMEGNYQNRLVIDNLQDYNIERVTRKFIDLTNL
tara:strand:+ start:3745 stop:4857 length:1113 start_codon:yes stop_codon:yes gene_type:complete